MNLFDADIHYLPFFKQNDFLCNKVIKKQEINDNSHLALSRYSIENLLINKTTPCKINTSLFDKPNELNQYNHNDILMNTSLDKYDESSIDSASSVNSAKNKSISLISDQNQLSSSDLPDNDSKTNLTKNEIISRVRWTREEENELIKITKKIGARKWKKVAKLMKNRTAKQCRDHYANCLNPDIKKSLWTIEEEKILIEKYEEYGTRWSIIKRYLPGRTTSMIKNYMRMILKNKEYQQLNKRKNYKDNKFENDMNEYSSSYNLDNTGSENEEQSITVPFNNDQEKYKCFNYHNIVCLLNQPSK